MISIIIPAWNQHEMTEECLGAIRENTSDCEVIIIDNGSNPKLYTRDGNVIWRIYDDHFHIIRNETNLGFPVAINQGIKAAKGSTIVLLNNDCVVSQGWSERLLRHLDSYSIVAPVTNYCAGLQRVTIPVYQDEQEFNQEAEKWAGAHKGESQEVNWVIGFCMAFKKSLWDEIGPFDESMWPCSGEEVDFCMKARKAGHKVCIAKDVYVHHEGSQTFKAMEKAGQVNYEETCHKNDRHLEEKWGKGVFVQSIEDTACEDAPGSTIKLNLGSGLRKIEGFINIDNRPEVNPDLVCDITQGLPFEDSSVSYVRAHDILEHIPLGKTLPVIEEIYRVLKPGGIFESFTPDAETGQGAFQDPHHLSFWVEQSWLYFSDPDCRALYGTKANFKIESIKRIESNYRVFHLHVIAKSRKEI